MLVSLLMFALSWAMGLSFVTASLAPLNSNLQIRNAPGTSSSDTLWALRRALSAATVKRDKNSTSLDKSWTDAVLFGYQNASVNIVCTTCYIKGTVTAQFTIDGGFNVSQAFDNVRSETVNEVKNITTAVENFVGNAVVTGDVDFPPIPVEFDLDLPDIPECQLSFQLDGIELYMQIDTTLSSGATYTLNLFTSETLIGFSVEDVLIGVIFSVDLILSVESEIDISSGFHIHLRDGIAINIPMFDQNVSSITFNGGNFEFLPVTIQSAGVVLTAVLRVGVKAGVDLSTSSDNLSHSFSTGIEVGVWADVAQFVTNVTAAPAGNSGVCELRVVEEYSMLLGANAGATVAIEELTWGPAPTKQVPIWYTTLLDACAVTRSTIAAPSAAANAVTITDKVTYTAIICRSTGLVNCPASLQSTSRVTKTLTTSVPSTQNTIASTIAFGTKIQEISATSGSPMSYIPTTTGIATTGGASNKATIGLSVGLSVGLGVPVLIAAAAGFLYYFKRKRSASVQKGLQTPEFHMSGKEPANVAVVEN